MERCAHSVHQSSAVGHSQVRRKLVWSMYSIQSTFLHVNDPAMLNACWGTDQRHRRRVSGARVLVQNHHSSCCTVPCAPIFCFSMIELQSMTTQPSRLSGIGRQGRIAASLAGLDPCACQLSCHLSHVHPVLTIDKISAIAEGLWQRCTRRCRRFVKTALLSRDLLSSASVAAPLGHCEVRTSTACVI